jgi:hypothetical protein
MHPIDKKSQPQSPAVAALARRWTSLYFEKRRMT